MLAVFNPFIRNLIWTLLPIKIYLYLKYPHKRVPERKFEEIHLVEKFQGIEHRSFKTDDTMHTTRHVVIKGNRQVEFFLYNPYLLGSSSGNLNDPTIRLRNLILHSGGIAKTASLVDSDMQGEQFGEKRVVCFVNKPGYGESSSVKFFGTAEEAIREQFELLITLFNYHKCNNIIISGVSYGSMWATIGAHTACTNMKSACNLAGLLLYSPPSHPMEVLFPGEWFFLDPLRRLMIRFAFAANVPEARGCDIKRLFRQLQNVPGLKIYVFIGTNDTCILPSDSKRLVSNTKIQADTRALSHFKDDPSVYEGAVYRSEPPFVLFSIKEAKHHEVRWKADSLTKEIIQFIG